MNIHAISLIIFAERSGIPLDYYSLTNKPPLPPSANRPNDNVQNDPAKNRLIEKKQQQWRQENGTYFFCCKFHPFSLFFSAEKAPVWNPFGRPGAGAPNTNENPPSRMPVCLSPSFSIKFILFCSLAIFFKYRYAVPPTGSLLWIIDHCSQRPNACSSGHANQSIIR